jgi:predicted permease
MLRDDDALQTYRSICAAAYERAGIPALVWEGMAGWANAIACAMRARAGRGPADVRRTAVESAGNRRGGAMFDDLRHALRRVRSRASVSVLAIGMLALAVGLTTAMFTLLDALLIRPVPFRAPAKLAQLAIGNEHGSTLTVSRTVLRAWQMSSIFASVQAVTGQTCLLEGSQGLVARQGALVTPGVFDMLGARPIRGRVFSADEGRAGLDDRVLISEDVWRSAYGRDAEIIGKRITIDGQLVTVVGVMPSDFRFPSWDTAVWKPIDYQTPGAQNVNSEPWPYARFRDDLPTEDTLRMATDIVRAEDPKLGDRHVQSWPLARWSLSDYYKRALPWLAGGVVLVFLVLCANVSSLLLAQYSTRRREFGVCSALGASRGRLLRQAILENMFLGVIGAIAGVVFAWLLVALSRGVLPEAFLLRTLNPISLNVRALLAAAAFGVAATLAAGVLPAWIGTKAESAEALRSVERAETQSPAAKATTRVMLVCEIALACTLLVGATLLARSFVNLTRADRGLNTEGVITTWIALPRGAYPDRPARTTATLAIEETVRAIPGIAAVALSYGLPPDGGSFSWGDWQSDVPGMTPVSATIESYRIGPEFFTLYGVPILRGRTFGSGEADDSVIVSERLAALLWPGVDPIGRIFQHDKNTYRVVGLAREINHPSVDARLDRPEYYEPFTVGGVYVMMSIRCAGTCPDGAAIRQKILAAVPRSDIVKLGPLQDVYDEQLAPPRAAAALSTVFAGVAVLAAAGGLFSVLSFAVGLRSREFGVRVALGASPGNIRSLVIRDGFTVAIAGFVIGAAAAWALGRALASFEYGITSHDPLSWMLVTGLVAVTVFAAAWFPARRAMRADPVALLREG